MLKIFTKAKKFTLEPQIYGSIYVVYKHFLLTFYGIYILYCMFSSTDIRHTMYNVYDRHQRRRFVVDLLNIHLEIGTKKLFSKQLTYSEGTGFEITCLVIAFRL